MNFWPVFVFGFCEAGWFGVELRWERLRPTGLKWGRLRIWGIEPMMFFINVLAAGRKYR
jgi:hypothetical protein